MTKRTLAEVTEQFKQKISDGSSNSAAWKLFFPFWKAELDTVSVVRFLPDANTDNPMGFLVENHVHELNINGKREKVPCLKMYGEDCPICALSQKYYDQKSEHHNETLGKKYYRKKSYIGQVLVLDTPIEHDHAQVIKLIEFGPALFKQIQASFQSGDLEEAPYELKGGYNFRIKKTKSGEYASYTTSSFAPKQTDVGDDVIETLELFNLDEYKTAKVSLEVLETMLAADQSGQKYSSSDDEYIPEKTKSVVSSAKTNKVTDSADESSGTPKMSIVETLRARAAAAKAAQAE
jgi:gp32 DNA binding protein like